MSHMDTRSISKTSRRRLRILYPSWIGSNKTSPRQQSVETRRRRNGEVGWPGACTHRQQHRPLPTLFAARSKKLKNCPRNCWQRAPSLGSQTRGRIPEWWRGSSNGFGRPSSVIRWVIVTPQRQVLLTGGQITQQQAMHRQITHLAVRCSRLSPESALTDLFLKSSFDKLLKPQEVIGCSTVPQHSLTIGQKPSSVRDKLSSVMARLDRLRNVPWKELQHER